MNIKQIENRYYMHTYNRNNLVVKKAKDQFIWDIYKNRYLDFFSGIGVCGVGHSNKNVIKAIKTQLKKFIHISNLYYAPIQIKLAKLLTRKIFSNAKIFFSNSGAEANECAIKLTRKWGALNPSKNGNRYEIICFNNSFHGRTMSTLSATGQNKFHNYFKPLQDKFVFAEINKINSVIKLINEKTVAIMIEPIQGEGGIIVSEKSFLKELRKICNNENLILIFDEVQCGIGRTGKFYAFENYDIIPDIVTVAKSLANGLPLGATIASERCAETFVYGDHGSTFGGNPISCASAVAVLKIMNTKFLNNSLKIAKYFRKKLEDLKNKHSIIKEIRGVGLMLGIDLDINNGQKIVELCMNNGLIINCTHETVIRFLPPLIITKEDVNYAVKILDKVLADVTF